MIGRRFLAVRSNEHAAASLGISIPAAKIAAFGLAAAIAALGGVLLAFRFSVVQYGTFDLFASLEVVILTVIGGTGYVMGAAIGSVLAPGGLVEFLTEGITDSGRWILLASGVGLLVTLIANPDGLADLVPRVLRRRTRAARRAESERPTPSLLDAATIDTAAQAVETVAAVTLQVEDLSVAFGGVHVLHEVSLSVVPGRITGLIGANGAGKTTLLEAVSGYVRPASGTVAIGDRVVTGRSATRLARAGIRRSFQGVESFDDLTVRENLLVAVRRASQNRMGARGAPTDRTSASRTPRGARRGVRPDRRARPITDRAAIRSASTPRRRTRCSPGDPRCYSSTSPHRD